MNNTLTLGNSREDVLTAIMLDRLFGLIGKPCSDEDRVLEDIYPFDSYPYNIEYDVYMVQVFDSITIPQPTLSQVLELAKRDVAVFEIKTPEETKSNFISISNNEFYENYTVMLKGYLGVPDMEISLKLPGLPPIKINVSE